MMIITGKNSIFLLVFLSFPGLICANDVHDNMVKLYRAFRTMQKDHFMTSNYGEHFSVIMSDQGKTIDLGYLGMTAMTKMCDCLIPLSRFFNSKWEDHFYTADQQEIATLQGLGYVPEGGVGFVANKPGCCNATLPVHRFWHPKLTDHHFATDTEEIFDFLRPSTGYNDEGIRFYIWQKTNTCSCVAPSGGSSGGVAGNGSGDASIQ